MKFILQCVKKASCIIDNEVTASIKEGLLIYMGIHRDDDYLQCEKWIDKILKCRLFADAVKPINRSIQDIDGEILIIPQFTLYANCSNGNRPSFTDAKTPNEAKMIYEHFVNLFKTKWQKTQSGTFKANMQIESINDGPVTIILE